MDSMKQRILDQQTEFEKKWDIACKNTYHLVQVSERRYGVVKVGGMVGGFTREDPPYLTLVYVKGLVKVDYCMARRAVVDLNTGQTKPEEYEKE